MKLLSRYVEALRLGAVIDSKAPAGGAAAGQTVITPVFETVSISAISDSTTSFTAYVNDNISGTFQLVGVSARFGTASSSGTLQVEVAGAGVAVASGTNQLTGTVSLAGTANTTVNGTLIASPTAIVAGSAVNVIIAGTMTSLANCSINIVLRRIA